MTNCKICGIEFVKKRKEQIICSVKCRQVNNGKGRSGQKTGPQSKNYKQRVTKDGYLRMYARRHPYANGRKEIYVHVMVMEMHIKRPIYKGECVHHKNHVKSDNRIENLELMTHANHSRLHNLELTKKRQRVRGKYA